jgi:hypothetical protein
MFLRKVVDNIVRLILMYGCQMVFFFSNSYGQEVVHIKYIWKREKYQSGNQKPIRYTIRQNTIYWATLTIQKSAHYFFIPYCIIIIFNSNKLTNVLWSLTKTINFFWCLWIINIKCHRSINYDSFVLAKSKTIPS